MIATKKIILFRYLPSTLLALFVCVCTQAQVPLRSIRPPIGNITGLDRSGQNQGSKPDTLNFEHRNDLADSVTITYRKFDSLGTHPLDTSINDFGKYYSLPTGYLSIGGNGNAAFPILFTPFTKPGWDPGFHAFDIYMFQLSNTLFYNTTKPFTTLQYYQGTGKEQIIQAFHTQNIMPNWNAGFNFRLISNPGIFQNQNVKDNNYRFFSTYQGKKKRYGAELVVIGNKIVSAENGGIVDPAQLADPNRKRRIAINVELGNNSNSANMIFSNQIQAGNKYGNLEIFFRHRYDFGIRDSIAINDSTTEYLFYPKFRIQHTIDYKESTYQFVDNLTKFATNLSDSAFFANYYNIKINPSANNFLFQDEWRYLSNDITLKQFPEKKNQNQFIEAGLRLENYSGAFTKPFVPNNLLIIFPNPPITKNYYNAVIHGEYRNKTRNKKWDALLHGEFYLAGFYTGEYSASASVERFLNKKWGTIQVAFDNISRSPSFVFQSNSAFNLDTTSLTKNENITILSFLASNNRFDLMVRNISIANYAYLTSYYEKDQYPGLINLTQGILSLKTKLKGHLNLYSDFILQQTTGINPIRVPFLYTRQRLAFEGRFFKNLKLSTGLDIRYNTPYKANHYSPVLGRFFPQDSITISNRPTLNAFFNFRIRRNFTMFVVTENLNTVDFKNGFSFTKNSFNAPFYPTPGFILRLGVKWDLVN